MKRYTIIYADPPWAYRDKAHAGQRGVEYHYPVMSDREIQLLPVASLAAEDCALFLWGPHAGLESVTLKGDSFVHKT